MDTVCNFVFTDISWVCLLFKKGFFYRGWKVLWTASSHIIIQRSSAIRFPGMRRNIRLVGDCWQIASLIAHFQDGWMRAILYLRVALMNGEVRPINLLPFSLSLSSPLLVLNFFGNLLGFHVHTMVFCISPRIRECQVGFIDWDAGSEIVGYLRE